MAFVEVDMVEVVVVGLLLAFVKHYCPQLASEVMGVQVVLMVQK